MDSSIASNMDVVYLFLPQKSIRTPYGYSVLHIHSRRNTCRARLLTYDISSKVLIREIPNFLHPVSLLKDTASTLLVVSIGSPMVERAPPGTPNTFFDTVYAPGTAALLPTIRETISSTPHLFGGLAGAGRVTPTYRWALYQSTKIASGNSCVRNRLFSTASTSTLVAIIALLGLLPLQGRLIKQPLLTILLPSKAILASLDHISPLGVKHAMQDDGDLVIEIQIMLHRLKPHYNITLSVSSSNDSASPSAAIDEASWMCYKRPITNIQPHQRRLPSSDTLGRMGTILPRSHQ
jgi:hypothetical protein